MIELGLERIAQLIATSSKPTKNVYLPWRAIHVAGTNGKGSVCAYISEMLNVYNRSAYRKKRNELRVKHGRFTSPHVIDRWDCITLSDFNARQTAEWCEEAHENLLSLNREHGIKASEFELLTATAFNVFTKAAVDIAVIETGMGGRLDATNILGQPVPQESRSTKGNVNSYSAPPLITAITKIGMDHQGFLGNTIEKIAREKAGIFKPDVGVVYDGSNPPNVCGVLEEKAKEIKTGPIEATKAHRDQSTSSHKQQNGYVAYDSAFRALLKSERISFVSLMGDEVEYSDLTNKMKRVPQYVRFPGRLEHLTVDITGNTQKLLLDGAHNPQSAEVLGKECDKIRAAQSSSNNITWILAASDGKDLSSMLQHLIKPGDSVFAVEFGPVDGMPWVKPMKASSILSTVEEMVPETDGKRVLKDCRTNLTKAMIRAAGHSRKHGNSMVIAGSLYLVGDVHRWIRDGKGGDRNEEESGEISSRDHDSDSETAEEQINFRKSRAPPLPRERRRAEYYNRTVRSQMENADPRDLDNPFAAPGFYKRK